MDQNQPPSPSNVQMSPLIPEAEPSTQPSPQPIQSAPPKRKRKGLWASIIVVAVVVVLAASTIAGYFLWYQNPDKVVTDGLIQAIQAKSRIYTGIMTAEMGEQSSVRLEFSGKDKFYAGELNAKLSVVYLGQNVVVEGDALAAGDGDIYIRFHNVDKMLELLAPAEPGSKLKEMTDAFVSKVEGQWVKIGADDLRSFSVTYADTQQCLTDVYKRVESDATMMSELADVYKNYRFILVTESLGGRDGSMGYRLEIDEAKFKDFAIAYEDTELYRQLRTCSANSATIKDMDIGDDNARIEVWTDQWSHEITRVRIDSTAESSGSYLFEVSPQFNQPVEVIVPESSLPLSELQTDIKALSEEVSRTAREEARRQQQPTPPVEQSANPTT